MNAYKNTWSAATVRSHVVSETAWCASTHVKRASGCAIGDGRRR